MLTRTLHKSTGADQLADRILERIYANGYAEGDFFMTEADVALEFGVGRCTTREAVSRLSALGILKGRRRKGLIVCQPCPVDLLSKGLPMLASLKDSVPDLFKLRYVIEVGAIELAVANASEEQIAQLAELAGQFEEVVRSKAGGVREDEVEVAFHGLILQMTGSPMVVAMQEVLARFFKLTDHEGICPRTDSVIWQHHELVAAIRDRDLERARAILRLHFAKMLSVTSKKQAVTSTK